MKKLLWNERKSRKLQHLFVIGLLFLGLLLFSGCGAGLRMKAEDGQTETAGGTENLVVVGVSQVGSESVWRTANTASIQEVFTKENGYFLIFENARQKQENQIKAIRSFISQQVDYIVFSPITETGWETVLEEAKEAGIPVILMDRSIEVEDESLYTARVGSNFFREGEKAGNYLNTFLKETGREEEEIQIVVLKGTQGSTSEIGRTRGFDSIAQKHKNWTILEQVDAEYTTTKGKEEMTRLLEQYPDIDVVISQNDDMTFGALEAMEEAGKTTGPEGEIAIISFDAVKAALELVMEGVINADIECNPEQGPYVEEVIRKLEAGEPINKYNYISEMEFTIQNTEQYMKERAY